MICIISTISCGHLGVKTNSEKSSSYNYEGTVSNCLYAFLVNGKIVLCCNNYGEIVPQTYHLWTKDFQVYVSIYESPVGELPRWQVNPNPYYGESSRIGEYKYWAQLGNEVFFIPRKPDAGLY